METNIYSYTVQGQERHADPLKLNRLLWYELEGEFDTILERARSQDPGTFFPARERLVQAIRLVFEVPEEIDPATGKGVSEQECLDILQAYLEWTEVKKKRLVGWQTCSPPTRDLEPCSVATPSSTMEPLSACGLTFQESE